METDPPDNAVEPPAPPDLLRIAQDRHAAIGHFLESSHEPTVDFVHDLRVMTRRLTEAARLLEPLMEKTAAAALVQSLRDLRRGTGELRDLDVLAEHLNASHLPAALASLRDEILADLPARREALAAGLRDRLASPALAASLMFLSRVMDEAARSREKTLMTLGKSLEKTIRKREKGLRRKLGSAAMKQTQEAFHNARISAKKLRYALELADEAGIAGQKQRLRFLKKMQSLIGQMHDADVIERTLQEHVAGSAVMNSKRAANAWKAFGKSTIEHQNKRAVEALLRGHRWLTGQTG